MKEEQVECPILGLQSESNLKSKIANLKLWGLSVITFVLVLTGGVAHAQQPTKVPRIGLLRTGAASDANVEAFRRGLQDLGYFDGKNILLEYRHAEGRPDRLPDLAAELVRLKVDVLVAGGGNATLAAKNLTKTIPIVMAVASDPVGTGLVASLARPGGNITGSTLINPDLSGKRLELIKEAVPGATQIAVLIYSGNPAYALLLKETEAAAQMLRLGLQVLEVRNSDEIENAIELVKKGRSQALSVVSSAFFTAQRKKIVESAERNRLPAVFDNRLYVETGGFMSYGVNIPELYRRAAKYVDKILKGAKPADLPVEQPTKFELIINLKAAKAIGLTIPETVLYRADKIIK